MWFKNGLGASALSERVEFTCESSVKHKKIERYYKPQIRNLLGFVGNKTIRFSFPFLNKDRIQLNTVDFSWMKRQMFHQVSCNILNT